MKSRIDRREFLQRSMLSGTGIVIASLLPATLRGKNGSQTTRSQNSDVQLLKPGRVFTAEDGKVHEGWVVLVRGERIAAVGSSAEVHGPDGLKTIELPGMALLPGLMDIHSHIFLHPYNETLWNDQVLKEPLAYRTIEAVRHCERTLMAGFTLLRDPRH